MYMTHFSNYARDRLALHVFERLFEFQRRWTRLELRFGPVWEVVEYHLSYNPSERPEEPTSLPIHFNPCAYSKHKRVWPSGACRSNDSHLPAAIIVGPQKTGSYWATFCVIVCQLLPSGSLVFKFSHHNTIMIISFVVECERT